MDYGICTLENPGFSVVVERLIQFTVIRWSILYKGERVAHIYSPRERRAAPLGTKTNKVRRERMRDAHQAVVAFLDKHLPYLFSRRKVP